eukprot:sb/3466922/
MLRNGEMYACWRVIHVGEMTVRTLRTLTNQVVRPITHFGAVLGSNRVLRADNDRSRKIHLILFFLACSTSLDKVRRKTRFNHGKTGLITKITPIFYLSCNYRVVWSNLVGRAKLDVDVMNWRVIHVEEMKVRTLTNQDSKLQSHFGEGTGLITMFTELIMKEVWTNSPDQGILPTNPWRSKMFVVRPASITVITDELVGFAGYNHHLGSPAFLSPSKCEFSLESLQIFPFIFGNRVVWSNPVGRAKHDTIVVHFSFFSTNIIAYHLPGISPIYSPPSPPSKFPPSKLPTGMGWANLVVRAVLRMTVREGYRPTTIR